MQKIMGRSDHLGHDGGSQVATTVSVVMAVHNGAAYLREAIDSVLQQSYTDFEFIIIDDASTDETPRILGEYRDPRIRILRNESNLGIAASLNRGIEAACAPLVARMDADDVCHPDRFAKQVAFLLEHPEVAVLGTNFEDIAQDGRRIALSNQVLANDRIQAELLSGCCICHPTVMFRREMIVAAGLYNAEYRVAQDFDLWLRVSERHEIRNLPDVLLQYRIHMAQSCFGKQRVQYWTAQNAIGDALTRRGMSKPEVKARLQTRWERLRGNRRSIGHNFMNFSNAFDMMGEGALALKAAGYAVVHSPLSGTAWAILVRRATDVAVGKKRKNEMRWLARRAWMRLGNGNVPRGPRGKNN